jgi:hypothetical protein
MLLCHRGLLALAVEPAALCTKSFMLRQGFTFGDIDCIVVWNTTTVKRVVLPEKRAFADLDQF